MLITEVTLFPNPSREWLEKQGLGGLSEPCWMLARQHLCAGNIRLMATTSNIIIFAIALVLALGMAGLTYSLIWVLCRAVFK